MSYENCNAPVEYARFQRVEVRGHHNIPDGVYVYRGRTANSQVYHMLTPDLNHVSDADAVDPYVFLVTNTALEKSVSPYVERPEVGQIWRDGIGRDRVVMEVTDRWVVCADPDSLRPVTHAYAISLDEFKKYKRVI